MRSLVLIVAGAVIALAPAVASVDSLSLGIFGDNADAIRERIVDGMTAAAPDATPVHHQADTRD